MKQKLFVVVMILALFAAVLPGSALAAKPQEVDLMVRNRADVSVQLNLTDANGNISFHTISAGLSSLTLTEGNYSFWASLPCGNIAGQWNVNVVKTLVLECTGDAPATSLKKMDTGSDYVGGNCPPAEGDYGLYYEFGSGTNVEFWTERHWDSSNGTTWNDVWYWMVYNWENNDVNGHSDAPGYCGTYNPDIADSYWDTYNFPPAP